MSLLSCHLVFLPGPASVITCGAHVELTGLATAKFNGMTGVVTAYDASSTPPRYEVEVEGVGNLRLKAATVRSVNTCTPRAPLLLRHGEEDTKNATKKG